MVDFRTITQNLSPAIVELDAAMRSGRLRHDGNPVLGWCIGNVVGHEDRRSNLFPTKRRDGKIDAAVALLMAIGRAGIRGRWRRGHHRVPAQPRDGLSGCGQAPEAPQEHRAAAYRGP